MKRGVIKSLLNRARDISSQSTLGSEIEHVRIALEANGYPRSLINKEETILKQQLDDSDHTVKNGVFQNSCLGCLNVHSSSTPNRVFFKPPFEGATGHPQNTPTIDSESLKGVLCKYLHY